MKKDAAFGLGLLVVTLTMALVGLGTMYHKPDNRPADSFPRLALSALDGSSATFDGRGMPAVVTVFATWCGPCREEFSRIATASSSGWAAKVDFVEIDDNEPVPVVNEFLKAYPKLRARVFIDRTNAEHELGIYQLPQTVSVDDGKLTGRFGGAMGYADLHALVEAAIRHRAHAGSVSRGAE